LSIAKFFRRKLFRSNPNSNRFKFLFGSFYPITHDIRRSTHDCASKHHVPNVPNIHVDNARVILKNNTNTFTRIAIGIATVHISDAHAIGEAPGHPTSTTESPRLNRSAISFAAGPRFSVNKLITSTIPTNPTPMVIPARRDLSHIHCLAFHQYIA
jgi:hypothetical protein